LQHGYNHTLMPSALDRERLEDYSDMSVFDYIMCNRDRYSLYNEREWPVATQTIYIDNGNDFVSHTSTRRCKIETLTREKQDEEEGRKIPNEPICYYRASLLSKIKALDVNAFAKSIHIELMGKSFVDQSHFDAMSKRIKHYTTIVERCIAQYGEALVLF
jgi:hypothetical protein